MPIFTIPLYFLLFLVAGCSSVSVQQDYDATVDFGRFQTFAWQSASQPQTGDPKVDNDLRDGRIRSAINDSLKAKGMREVDRSDADILLAYFVSFERRLNSSSVSIGVGRGSYGRYGSAGLNTGITEYEQGRLTIDMIDPADGKTVWRGEGTRVVSEQVDPQKSTQRIRDAVQKILKKFPPRP